MSDSLPSKDGSLRVGAIRIVLARAEEWQNEDGRLTDRTWDLVGDVSRELRWATDEVERLQRERAADGNALGAAQLELCRLRAALEAIATGVGGAPIVAQTALAGSAAEPKAQRRRSDIRCGIHYAMNTSAVGEEQCPNCGWPICEHPLPQIAGDGHGS